MSYLCEVPKEKTLNQLVEDMKHLDGPYHIKRMGEAVFLESGE